ncbi:MAG: hypothetical protein QXG05_08600 [Nitrososphaerota archaeon]
MLERIVVYKGLKVTVNRGKLEQMEMGEAIETTEKEYYSDFKGKAYYKFDEFKRKIEEAKLMKESTTEEFEGKIRYGGGHFVILQDDKKDKYAIFVVREKDAKRDPNMIDIAAGMGDTYYPIETMLRETCEEFLIYRKGSSNDINLEQIIPVVNGSQYNHYNEIIQQAARTTSQICGEHSRELFLTADSTVPSNSVKVKMSDGSVMECGVFFGNDSIEFTNTLIIHLDGEIENDLILRDGERIQSRCLDRKMLLVSIKEGECISYEHGVITWRGKLEKFLEKNFDKTKPIATIKVTGIIKNWNKNWGKKGVLAELLKWNYGKTHPA